MVLRLLKIGVVAAVLGSAVAIDENQKKHHKKHHKHKNLRKAEPAKEEKPVVAAKVEHPAKAAVLLATSVHEEAAKTVSQVVEEDAQVSIDKIQEALEKNWKNKPRLEHMQKSLKDEKALLQDQVELSQSTDQTEMEDSAKSQRTQAESLIKETETLFATSRANSEKVASDSLTKAKAVEKKAAREIVAARHAEKKAQAAKDAAEAKHEKAISLAAAAQKEIEFYEHWDPMKDADQEEEVALVSKPAAEPTEAKADATKTDDAMKVLKDFIK
eukprot:TRINITY_DN5226_c0_g1_i1.p1 TRINITY_DN5226_c0_g1~~TRINITY_DN5226_c0_g1_i1.p1  ORF type:complete len:272 (-),score=110.26 TRINITY_DN5226_c0_g1_i1:263-1078(-)